MIEKLYNGFLLLIVVVVLAGIAYLTAGALVQNPDEIIRVTEDSIYVKKYSLFNINSEMLSYRSPSVYDGEVVGKYLNQRMITVRRQSRTVREYYITVEYNGRKEDIKNKDFFEKCNIGDIVEVKESWYPSHNLEVLKIKK